MASHDRALIDRLATKLIIVENGEAAMHLGNYSHYRWLRKEQEAPEEEKNTEDVLKIRRGEEVRKEKKTRDRNDRKQRRQLEQLEEDIESMESLIEGFDEKFSQVDPSDYQKAQELKDEYEGLKTDLQELYQSWEELSE